VFGWCSSGTECPIDSEATSDPAAQNRLFAGKKSGARRIRTADLLGAIQALCQLSYSPEMPDLQVNPAPHREEQRRSLAGMYVDIRRCTADMRHSSNRSGVRLGASVGDRIPGIGRSGSRLASEATVEATHEAVLNSIFAAETTVGFADNVIRGLPVERVAELLRAAAPCDRSSRRTGGFVRGGYLRSSSPT
jgi:hypothetical protein